MFEEIKKRLKEGTPLIHFDFSALKQICGNVNITLFSNNSTSTDNRQVFDESKRTLKVNLASLSPQEREQYKKFLKDAIEADFVILDQKSAEIVKDVQAHPHEVDPNDIVGYFRNKVTPQDLNTLRAGLYIMKSFKSGKPVDNLKQGIRAKYGPRGINIVNLAGAGYFEKELKPLYEALKVEENDEVVAKEKFTKIYNKIVDECPFMVFVNRNMATNELKRIIIQKFESNVQYGIKYLKIHGIGRQNIKTIRETVTKIEEEKKIEYRKQIEEDDNIILMRLELPSK